MRWLWERSTLPGVAKCHRVRYGSEVTVWLLPGGGGFYGGFCRCASVWACPLCAPAIRAGRARELAAGLRRALQEGCGALHSTYTLPHDQGDRLAPLFDAVSDSWQSVTCDRVVRQLRAELGLHFVRSTEVTVGPNGWHPHLHVGEVSPVPLTRTQILEYRREAFRAWCSAVERHGYRPPSDRYGLSMSRADVGMADYVSKVQGLADEMLRLDRKSSGRTDAPFTVLARAVAGDERSAALWSEYESATKARRALGFSKGFRALCPVEESPEDDLLRPDGAVYVGSLRDEMADLLVKHPNGFEGFLEMVGPGTPEAWRAAVAWLVGTAPLFLDPSKVWEDLKTLVAQRKPVQGVLF